MQQRSENWMRHTKAAVEAVVVTLSQIRGSRTTVVVMGQPARVLAYLMSRYVSEGRFPFVDWVAHIFAASS